MSRRDEALQVVQLASAVTVPTATPTLPVKGVYGGSYIWSVVGTFGGGTITLEALGPDGTTYQTVDTMTASGVKGIVLGNNASVRLKATTADITACSSSLS